MSETIIVTPQISYAVSELIRAMLSGRRFDVTYTLDGKIVRRTRNARLEGNGIRFVLTNKDATIEVSDSDDTWSLYARTSDVSDGDPNYMAPHITFSNNGFVARQRLNGGLAAWSVVVF